MKNIILASTTALMLAACTTTGNIERNTALGAASGAILGGIIGNNTGSGSGKDGAILGAIVGGAGGIYTGAKADQTHQYSRVQSGQVPAHGHHLQYSQNAAHGDRRVAHHHNQASRRAAVHAQPYYSQSSLNQRSYAVQSSAASGGQNQSLQYDQFGGRYYYTDHSTGNTYWQNGALRTRR